MSIGAGAHGYTSLTSGDFGTLVLAVVAVIGAAWFLYDAVQTWRSDRDKNKKD